MPNQNRLMPHTKTCKRDGCGETFSCAPSRHKEYCSNSCARIRKTWTLERMDWIRANRDKMTITDMAAHFEVDAHVLSKAVSDYRRNDPSMPYLLKSLVGAVRIRTSGYGVEFKYTKEADGKWSRVKTGEDKRRKAPKVTSVSMEPTKPVKHTQNEREQPKITKPVEKKGKTRKLQSENIQKPQCNYIRESKTIPPDKVAVRINSKTIVWRSINKVA